MARSNRRRRAPTGWTTRQSPQALGHTVGQPRDTLNFGTPPATGGFTTLRNKPVRPSIRTVLEISSPPRRAKYPAPSRGKRQSPQLAVRATGRSTDRQIRSPFLNATMLTPELTERALVCARRNIRREVIFAQRKTGKGSRSPKRIPSKVRC